LEIARFKKFFFLRQFLWLGLLLPFALSCAEQTENDQGVIMLPTDAVGELPARLEMRRALEGVSVQGEPAGKGSQKVVYVGRAKQYQLRTLLTFKLDLPAELKLVSATLQFYIIGTVGQAPITLSVHKLTTDFDSVEVTWEQSAAGRPWMTPGGDFESTPLGSTEYPGGEFDTLNVSLDLEALEAHLSGPERSELPLVVISEEEEVFVKLLASEYAPLQPVAARLNVIFTAEGGTEQLLLERRAWKDATIVHYDGQVSPDRLVVGENPASQVFFSYDLGELPPEATVNQALLHLSVSGGAVLDSFLVTAFVTDETGYVEAEGDLLPVVRGGTSESDSVLVLDITGTLQLMILQKRFDTAPRYFGLASAGSAVAAGFLEFYPESWPDSLLRPYLIMIYSDPMKAPLPY